jgi:ferredoxin
MRIEINLRTCVRSGQCSYLHPELFDRDSEDFPASKVEHPGEEHRAAIEDAVELCPTSSISLVEDDE